MTSKLKRIFIVCIRPTFVYSEVKLERWDFLTPLLIIIIAGFAHILGNVLTFWLAEGILPNPLENPWEFFQFVPLLFLIWFLCGLVTHVVAAKVKGDTTLMIDFFRLSGYASVPLLFTAIPKFQFIPIYPEAGIYFGGGWLAAWAILLWIIAVKLNYRCSTAKAVLASIITIILMPIWIVASPGTVAIIIGLIFPVAQT